MIRKEDTHNATVTLVLPADMSTRDEIAALRIAGVPIDEAGQVEFGFLFQRWRRHSGRTVFRWFAQTPGQGVMPMQQRHVSAA